MNSVEKKEKVINSKSILKIQKEDDVEGQVVIHVVHQGCFSFCLGCEIEIHRDIHLIADSSLIKSNLIHIVNSSSKLEFKKTGMLTHFTLIFSALPKSSKMFNFIEPGERGWRLLNIKRNKTDVYNIKVHKQHIYIINSEY